MFEDYPNICRCCLQNGQLESAYEFEVNGTKLFEIIRECASIEISEDDMLPKTICLFCIDQFRISRNIRRICEDSDKKLQDWLKDKGSNIPDIPALKFEIIFPEQEKFDDQMDNSLRVIVEDSESNKCEICSKTFRYHEHLLKHTDNYHKNTPPAKHAESPVIKEENDDDDRMSEGRLSPLLTASESSMDTAPDGQSAEPKDVSFECHICYMKFSRKIDLNVHKKTHTKERPYKCILCEKSFLKPSALNVHKSKKHAELTDDNGESSTKDEQKKYVCKLCEMQFTCKRKIYKHLSTECHSHLLPFECKSCKVMLQNSNELEEHVKLHKKDYTSFFCEFCGQGFKNASILKYHKRIHTREIVFKCPICDKEFVRNSTLQLHIKVHLNEKPFKCDMCEKSFRENHILQAHIRVHTGDLPFACDKCDRRFPEQKRLTIHKYGHDEKELIENSKGKLPQYACSHCPKKFYTKHKLYRHNRTHNQNHQCCYCGQKFGNLITLQRHEHSHPIKEMEEARKILKCNRCDNKYATENQLINHLRNYHCDPKYLKKKYKCEICSKKFPRPSILRYHQMTHNKSKPYQCGVCGKEFKHAKTYAMHKRRICKEIPTSGPQTKESAAEVDIVNQSDYEAVNSNCKDLIIPEVAGENAFAEGLEIQQEYKIKDNEQYWN